MNSSLSELGILGPKFKLMGLSAWFSSMYCTLAGYVMLIYLMYVSILMRANVEKAEGLLEETAAPTDTVP